LIVKLQYALRTSFAELNVTFAVLPKKGHGIQGQDYRQLICDAVKIHHPDAEIIDPFSIFPDSVKYNERRARQVFFTMAAEAGSSDIVLAYLPKASMGTALEMILDYDNG